MRSIHSPRKIVSRQSKNFTLQKRNKNIVLVVAAVIALSIFIFVVSVMGKVSAFQIETIEIIGADQEIAESLKVTAMQSLEGKYGFILPRANTLFYPHDDIVEGISAASPNIEKLEVERRGLKALVISINQKDPAALVCTSLPDWNSEDFGKEEDGCYFADEDGLIIEESPAFSGTAYHRYYIPELVSTGEASVIGLHATSSQEFRELDTLYTTIEKNKIEVEGILIKSDGEYELFARNSVTKSDPDTSSLSQIIVIYFNNRRSISEQLSNLISFWTEMKEKAQAKHEVLHFDYIDVRYGSNVFYRLLN